MTKRISVSEVMEAYRKTGMLPIRGLSVNSDGTHACAIGAMARAAGLTGSPLQWAWRQYGEDYADDFQNGFDCLRSFDNGSVGWRDGYAASLAVGLPAERVQH